MTVVADACFPLTRPQGRADFDRVRSRCRLQADVALAVVLTPIIMATLVMVVIFGAIA